MIAVAVVVGIAFAFSPIRDPRSRLEHEHGLRLPASANSIECRGDAARGFLDRGAASAFVMDANDLAAFISQLKVRLGGVSFIPANSEYQLHTPWRQGTPAAVYTCASPTGDWLHVEVWAVDAARVGVCLYTDWN